MFCHRSLLYEGFHTTAADRHKAHRSLLGRVVGRGEMETGLNFFFFMVFSICISNGIDS